MAQLWGGRFTKATDQKVYDFNASIGFDKRMLFQDICGSIAHARMLGRQGIISETDALSIEEGLKGIFRDVSEGKLKITSKYEDVHSFCEAVLTERVGEAGKRLHTGRSRNDQVALDMRLYTRGVICTCDELLNELLKSILEIMKSNTDTFMPGFTHLQKAQPVTLAHHMGAYFEMFKRDRKRLRSIYERMNECPLGSGALAGTTYPLDRDFVAESLGFDRPTSNSMDSVSDRDYLIEFLDALSIIMMHLSRSCEEIITWNTNEYRFVEIDDTYSTGSSIMPQKKNPDIAELVRGKAGRVYGSLMGLLTVMKGLPLAYNKDMQEDKEGAFDAMDTALSCIDLYSGMLKSMTFNKDIMARSALGGFTNATDAADYMVVKGVPFRDAHSYVGRMVLYCIDKKLSIDEMSLEELKKICPVIEEDFYDAVSLKTCVDKRLTKGAPGPGAMKSEIEESEKFISENAVLKDPLEAFILM